MTNHVQQTLPSSWQGRRQYRLQLLIQSGICAPGTHYCSVEQAYKVYPILLHMTCAGIRTLDLLTLCPIPYPLGHMLPPRRKAQSPELNIYRMAGQLTAHFTQPLQ